MNNIRKTITIFGSSLPKPGDSEYENAYLIGKLLAQNNFDVCSGGNQGIMDAVSKGSIENGGKAIGITVSIFNSIPSNYLTTKIECNTLYERIDKLIQYGDAYLILPGGTGTLLELSVVWEFLNKNIMEVKPVVCLGKMWKNIVNEMEKRIVIEKRKTDLISCFDKVEDCTNFLKLMLINN